LWLKESEREKGMCWGDEQKVRIHARKLCKDVKAVAVLFLHEMLKRGEVKCYHICKKFRVTQRALYKQFKIIIILMYYNFTDES
jgi:hypothetical protein